MPGSRHFLSSSVLSAVYPWRKLSFVLLPHLLGGPSSPFYLPKLYPPPSPGLNPTTSMKLFPLHSKPSWTFLLWKKPWESRSQFRIFSHVLVGCLSHLLSFSLWFSRASFNLTHSLPCLFKRTMSRSSPVSWIEPKTHIEANSWPSAHTETSTHQGPANRTKIHLPCFASHSNPFF